MFGGIVRIAVRPGAPEDAYPSAGEDADGMGMITAAGACLSDSTAGGIGGNHILAAPRLEA